MFELAGVKSVQDKHTLVTDCQLRTVGTSCKLRSLALLPRGIERTFVELWKRMQDLDSTENRRVFRSGAEDFDKAQFRRVRKRGETIPRDQVDDTVVALH